MLQKTLNTLFIVVAGLLLVACGPASTPEPIPEPAPVPTPVPENTGILVLGDISDEPAKKIKRFQPLADYLAARLGEFGIGVGEVKIAPDIETMSQWMKDGKVDLYFDSLYPALLVSQASGAQPILRRWKKGNDIYHSVFFSLADSGISSIEDLNGKIVALEDPLSTSGFMLPMAYMIEAGLNPVEKSTFDSVVAGTDVGYIFSSDDENTLQWVISGQVPVGVTDNGNFSDLQKESNLELMIVAETESVARQVVVVRPGMDPAALDVITGLLLGLDETDEGQAVLKQFKTTRFDQFPEGAGAALVRMQELVDLVQSK